MIELVPLKVRIGLKFSDGRRTHDFPNFNMIPSRLRDGMDWSHYIDQFGGWHYDKQAGHQDDDPDNDSPRGTWIGMLLVPEDFALEAVKMFPDRIEILDEGKCAEFYNNRAHAHEPEIHEDVEVLQAIATRKQLENARGAAPDIQQEKLDEDALDPDKPQRGRRRNKKKFFDSYKKVMGISIRDIKKSNA